MRLRFVQRTDCDALAQLVTPCLRQVRGGDIGGLHFVRKLKSKEIGRHATINGHGAVAISHVVVRLAPRVRAPASAGQCQHGKNAGNNHRKLIAALLGARGLLLLDLLIADGFGHIRVVGVGGQAPIRLLHHRNLTGIGIGSFTGLLADGGRCTRVWTTVWPWFARSPPRARWRAESMLRRAGRGNHPHAVRAR